MLASVSVYSAGSFRHTYHQLLKILVLFCALNLSLATTNSLTTYEAPLITTA